MIPTRKEYQKAKKIVDAYEAEQDRLYQLRVEAFKKDLEEYFRNNLIDGELRLYEFKLRGEDIIPINPCLEEMYEGGNDDDIRKLCNKHGVNFSIIYWCYHK